LMSYPAGSRPSPAAPTVTLNFTLRW
jgi:hypothetical protein